jgi:RNA polymerase sigma factor (TIGR02999 family)
MAEVTELLVTYRGGNAGALDQLLPLVYDELHRIAQNSLRHERGGHTLQATALVNEAYLRLVEQRESNWQNRAHFLGIAARLMRRILLDYARRRHAQRRGGPQQKLTLDEALAVSNDNFSELIALDDALLHLAHIDPQQAQIAELHLFGGLTMKEIAEVLGCDEHVPPREWRMAKAWLHSNLSASSAAASSG